MILRQFGFAVIAGGLGVAPALAQPATRAGEPAAPTPGAPAPRSPDLASSLLGSRVQLTHGGYLSSKLVGATVYNDQNQSIGSIDNLIIGPSGQVTRVVLSVGGFLGIDTKLVDVPFSQLQFRAQGSSNGRQIMLPHASKPSLMSMEAFSYNG